MLDWGGGPGFLAYLLEALGFETTYYDLKYDYPSYQLVQGMLKGQVRYVGEDQVALPFDTAAFDAVISFGVLEHVPDPSGSLRELHRVLEENGKLFVFHFPNRHGYIETAAKRLGRPVHDLRLTKREFTELLNSANFSVDKVWYRYLLPRNLTDMPRIRRFVDRHAKGVYAFDATLTRIPGLRSISTTLNAICTRAGAERS